MDATPCLSSTETSPPPSSHIRSVRPIVSALETPQVDQLTGDATRLPDPGSFNDPISSATSTLGTTNTGTVEETLPSLPWTLSNPLLSDGQIIPDPGVVPSNSTTPLDTHTSVSFY
ncbi:hypothetical protein EYZ11_001557 [Aspergillus tanneri]|uniref:Uncharacterized protein n=1 Tax=Aspergillus tanneri TaxID=1220188 RepID=A0A4S3JTF2_9EURO|nr:hypothetical protein EYZ11_001557 [Aspergillus tanneri]